MRGLVLVVAMLAGGAWMTDAQARIVDQVANGFTVENSQWAPTDPAASWKAFAEDVGKWWPADHTWWGDASKLSISQKVGGCFCEINGAQQAWHMTVVFVDPVDHAHDRRPGSAAGHGPERRAGMALGL